MSWFEFLFAIYCEELERSRKLSPNEYAWGDDEHDAVVERMRIALHRMSFDKESETWKRTCKRIGIKHTYKAIEHFIKTGE